MKSLLLLTCAVVLGSFAGYATSGAVQLCSASAGLVSLLLATA